MSFPRYSAYKDSGVEWLGQVPEHWDVVRLKQACDVFPSNVDKLSRDDEPQVFLCNYTDVYYNDKITQDMSFMSATAAPDQISRFTLKAGDTIITKDSETADDIAISAYVPQDLPGVVCGYHLSMIRPKSGTSGAFVKRLFDSTYLKSKVSVAANGLTRVGLGQYAIDNLEVPLPPEAEQALIASFLDDEIVKIAALVAEQERLIGLLKEKRQAVISNAVTKGLDPSVPMKDSGVKWLGEVPKHWEIKSLRYVLEAIGDVDHFMPASVEIGVPYLMTGDLKELLSEVDLHACKQVERGDYIELSRKIKASKGDVVMARYATIGTLMYVDMDADFLVSYSCVTLKTRRATLSGLYLFHSMKSDAFRQGIENKVNTNTQGNVGTKDLQSIKIAVPPIEEQDSIVKFLNSEITKFRNLEAESQCAINLLQERRTALISAAVAGQIDVRSVVTEREAA